MPSTPHLEQHFTSSEVVRDIVIGMSDGLTVPFALAAGLTGAVHASHIIVVAGLAEIAAGSIAMGLGGYLAAKSDAEHYESERRREEYEVIERNEDEVQEVHAVFSEYGLTEAEIEPVVRAFQNNHKAWVDWMMRFELGLEEPDPKRAVSSATTIALSYIAGGLVPLTPYMIWNDPKTGFMLSVVATLTALFFFGFVKGRYTGAPRLQSALRTTIIGGLAAGVAYAIAKAVA
ncbi:MAG TPA: VIT1/CCC1 transporter family protein [Bryobacteraceae bacterium]|jgi:VIT1/CCC1 family predicted Fe2+/Mn2+ transporter